MKYIRVCVVVFIAILTSNTLASGIAPYLPINSSPILENEVERLAVIAGIPNLTKPYNLATIFHYMEKIKETHPRLYSRLNLSLTPYTKTFAMTHASVSGSYSDERHPIPNFRGNTSNSDAYLSIRSQWQVADWLAIYAGAEITDEHNQVSGSYLSLGVDWAQLDIGYKDLWFSPFQGSAQLISTNAQTMPSISLSNNLPYKFLGVNWNYHIFLAQMSRQLVLFEGQLSDEDKPWLAGVHMSVQPTPWWTLGASRMFQFGGGERPVSFKTFARAFFDPRGADNDASEDEESGNQIASVSSKINFDGALPFSFALELAGEDTSNNKSYQLGNTAITAGLFFPYFYSDNISLAYEYSDWQIGWYVNNVYQEGYTNEDLVLGHWAMQAQHQLNTAVEGSSHFFKTQWQTPGDNIIVTTLRISEHEDAGAVDYKQAWELNIDYSMPLEGHILTLGTFFGRDSLGDDFSQVRMTLAW